LLHRTPPWIWASSHAHRCFAQGEGVLCKLVWSEVTITWMTL
jgi:hypothetical protein